MFDWDDQELVNILWDQADDSDDHIVPYPCGSEEIPLDVFGDLIKKGWNEETANEKPSKQKHVPLSELNEVKQEKISQCDKNEGLSAAGNSVDSWNALSLSNMSKSCQNLMADEPAKLERGSQIFQNPNDDKASDLIGCDWDNIGSFEDLDRIFSNGDPEFGCTRLVNADELWLSSKDIASSPEKCASLEFSSLGSGAPSTSENCCKTEDIPDQALPFATEYDNVTHFTCRVPQTVRANMNHPRHAEINNDLFVEDEIARDMVSNTLRVNSNLDTGNVAVPTKFSDKMYRQKNTLRRRKRSGEESEARPYQDIPETWFSLENQFLKLEGQYAKTGKSRAFLGINQQMKLQEPASPPYSNVTTPLFSPSGHTSMQSQDPVTPILPQLYSGFEVLPCKSTTLNEFPGSPANPLTMTPQEKVKKLRRRQQLRAMLAIQNQQKQFGHQTSESQHSFCQKYNIADQMQPVGGNLEVDNNTNTILTLNPNSPSEQDYSGTMSMAADDCSLEDAILYRLQDIVAKLDIQLRLCIRDSLFRLAQSATQRQFAKDTSSTMERSGNYLEFLSKEDSNSNNRSARTPEAENDTNPIDRTVAHLLFHRPIEFSGNPEIAESPASAKLPQERKTSNLLSMPRGVLAENYESMETRSDVVLRGPVSAEVEMS